MSSATSFSAATAAPESINTAIHTPKRSASNTSPPPGAAPRADAIRTEPSGGAGPRRLPDIDVEDARELLRRGERDKFRAILEAAGLNHPMKDLGLKLGNNRREVRGIQQANEQGLRFRHGSGMIP